VFPPDVKLDAALLPALDLAGNQVRRATTRTRRA
jgi:hypothetical protein